MTSSNAEKKAGLPPGLGAIFLVVFLDILGFSLILPFLAEEARDTFGTTAFTGTLLASIYSLMQFLFVPVWGRVSDRIGRRPVLMWSVLATSLGMLALGLGLVFAQTVAWLFVARAASGIATANLGTASAYIADVTPPQDRARGMGLIGAAFGLGFILGPGIGGALSSIRIEGRAGAVPCFVAATLSLVNFAWTALAVRESLPEEKRARGTRSLSPLNVAAARDAFTLRGVFDAVLVNFALILSFTVLDQTFRFFNKDVFGVSALGTGIILACVGVVAAVVQGGLMRPLSRRYGEVSLIRAGTLIQSLAFFGFAASPMLGRAGLAALLIAAMALALGNGLTAPSIPAFISKRADASSQGNTLGTNQSFAALARMFGPALGGWLYGRFGPSFPYLAGAIGMALSFVVALRLTENRDGAGDAQRKTSTQTS